MNNLRTDLLGIQQQVEKLVTKTPTSTNRNRLCDLNMYVMLLMDEVEDKKDEDKANRSINERFAEAMEYEKFKNRN